jgi:NAD(P)-dependent dehydrogenase (short-subunit alcohol dehydrogenase family)
MAEQTILVTGSTDGIGRQTALELAKQGNAVWLHGRNEDRCRSAMAEISRLTGNEKLRCFVADLADLSQVHRLVQEVRNAASRLDVLINNAGVFRHKRELTPDGFEMTFAVNHLAHFALTLGLVEQLRSSAPSRVVTVSSMVHADSIDFDNLQGEKGYSGFGAYSRSKLCNILFTCALADRLQNTGVTANCLHPGVINTKLLRASWSGGDSVSEGAKTPVYLATAPEAAGHNGRYFVNRILSSSAPITQDREVRERLWSISEALTGARWPEGPR